MLKYIEIIFIVIFTLEALIKLLAMGIKSYMSDTWNVFDLVVLIGSYFSEFYKGSSITWLRLVRVLRFFRVIKRQKNLRILSQATLQVCLDLVKALLTLAHSKQ